MADKMESTAAEEMETEEKSSSSEDSEPEDDVELSGDESDKDEEKEALAASMAKKISQNPYAYDTHIQLIELLKSMGELERLRDAREHMSKLFPLTEEIWLSWLRDEIKLVSTDQERQKVNQLFERAVQDYLSVEIWLEWAQYSIGGMSAEGGISSVRAVLDKALTAAGLHVGKGVIIWEAYREFENVLLSMLDASSEEGVSQRVRVVTLYRRQLSVPLLDMQATREELKSFATEQEQTEIEPGYQRALKKLAEITPFEERLLQCSKDGVTAIYKEYINYERKKGEPARAEVLYERALAEAALDAALWLEYVNFVDRTLGIPTVATSVCTRALRNVPWDARLWVATIRSAERHQREHLQVQGLLEQALGAGLSTANDYKIVWEAYLDYIRRRVPWEEPQSDEKEKRIKELRDCTSRALEHIHESFGIEADPQGELTQSWARWEASHCGNMEQARQLWGDLLAQNEALYHSAATWLQYIQLEQQYGDSKHLRRLFGRAVSATRDWPEGVVQAWLAFERDQGDLESFEVASDKVEVRMKKLAEDRLKEQEQNTTSKFKKMKLKRKWEESSNQQQQQQQQQTKGKWADAEESGGKRTFKHSLPHTTAQPPKKQPFVPQQEKQKTDFKAPPPPGYKPPSEQPEPSDTKKSKDAIEEAGGHENRTVFVSNLHFDIGEAEIRSEFSQVGTITDVRLVKDFKGRSKGFCYVEFSSFAEANKALQKDRDHLNDRPMFVSKCNTDSSTRQKVFKYSMGIEKNKLFVKGLPMSMDQNAVRTYFEPYGTLKDVRLVTYRNGHSKGLAYVDYENEAEAAHALVKTDGQELDGHTITVAISRPPERKQTSLLAPDHVASLGGRPFAGSSRSSKGAPLMPRSVRLAMPSGSEPAKAPSNGSDVTMKPAPSATPRTNQDFRSMLLEKK